MFVRLEAGMAEFSWYIRKKIHHIFEFEMVGLIDAMRIVLFVLCANFTMFCLCGTKIWFAFSVKQECLPASIGFKEETKMKLLIKLWTHSKAASMKEFFFE